MERDHTPELHRHSLRVGMIVAAFTRYLGYSRQEQITAIEAALLHDIGKSRISPETLRKPGPLSVAEMQIVKCHPDIGALLLLESRSSDLRVLNAIQQHHERLDGTGYPRGLRGSSVCELARILSICDVFAALTEERAYQAPYAQDQAVQVLLGKCGALDTALVNSFAQLSKRQTVIATAT